MNTKDFIKKYQGKTVGFPDNNFYKGECLSLVKVYIKETTGIYPPASGCNGARCYWSIFPSPLSQVFEKIPNTPDFTPIEGDIMVWNEKTGGGYGHIAICTGKNTGTQYFESFDQNWQGRHAHLVNHNYKNVYGVLRLKKEVGNLPTMPEKPKYDEAWIEEQLMHLKNEREKTDRLRADLDGANAKADQRKKEYETLLENLAKKLTLPATSDISDILGGVERLLSVEETLRVAEKELSKQKEKHEQEREQFSRDLEVLRLAIDKQQRENETLIARIDDLEKRLEAREEAIVASSKFGLLIEKLLRIFK
jgi:hypothetical protein